MFVLGHRRSLRISPRLGSLTLLVLALALLTAACGGDGDPDSAAPDAAPDAESPVASTPDPAAETPPAAGVLPPGDPDAGREVFFANGCTVCHGEQGQGGIGPTLAQTPLLIDAVISQVRSPRGIMPRFDVTIIPDAQLADVLSWLQTLPLPE